MIVVTVQHRIVYQLHLLLLIMSWYHLLLRLLTLPQRGRVRSLQISHKVLHESFSKAIQWTFVHLLLSFEFLLSLQGVTDRLHYLLPIPLFLLYLLFDWRSHRSTLHLYILLYLVISIPLRLILLTGIYRISHHGMLKELTIRKSRKFLTELHILRVTVMITALIELMIARLTILTRQIILSFIQWTRLRSAQFPIGLVLISLCLNLLQVVTPRIKFRFRFSFILHLASNHLRLLIQTRTCLRRNILSFYQ